MRTIYRYSVPVDLRAHIVELTGEILSVGCRDPRFVEFWAEHDEAVQEISRTFQVFGTGHDLPHDARYVGTAVTPNEVFVWHLYELVAR